MTAMYGTILLAALLAQTGGPRPPSAPVPAAGSGAAPPASAPAATPAPGSAAEIEPGLLRRLEAIDGLAAKVHDLTADFEQRRSTPLLKKPMISSGRVRVKGATVRWETRSPAATTLVIDPASLKIYYPEQASLEVYPVESGLARLAATPLPRLAAIREQFTIRECPISDMDGARPTPGDRAVALLLTPRGEDLKKHVREVRVLLGEPPPTPPADGGGGTIEERRDGPSGVARQIEVTDADGDRTIVVFKEARVNTGLSDTDLELRTPDGTRVSHPLGGAGAERKAGK